jgi:cysteine desulfurase
LAAAVELAAEAVASEQTIPMQTAMIQALLNSAREIPFTHIHHTPDATVPEILNLCFDYLNGADLVSLLSAKGICVSSSSACASGTGAPSHVLLAMGLSPDTTRGALRISLGRHNTLEEIQALCNVLPRCVEVLRKQNPTYKKRKENQNHE